MIYHLNGTLELCEEGSCVIDCGGVGYKLFVSDNTYTAIVGHIGKPMKLLTYLQVREDAVELYGFKTNDELSAFKLLITVSGVGPKAAMSILSLLTPDRLSMAICGEDTKTIAKANGIGAKTAARVVLELKDKISIDPKPGCRFAARCPYATEACKQPQQLEEILPNHFISCCRAKELNQDIL